MIYVRTDSNPRGSELSVTAARTASTLALAAYPAGALVLRFVPDSLATTIAGYGLILLALVMAGVLSGSWVQRVVAEQSARLDEYELALRRRALGFAYGCFSALVLLALFYAAVATDVGGWVPSTYDEFNGLFWGVFLYSMVLPSAFLAWTTSGQEPSA